MLKTQVQELLNKYECKTVQELKALVESSITFAIQKRQWIEHAKWEGIRSDLIRKGII